MQDAKRTGECKHRRSQNAVPFTLAGISCHRGALLQGLKQVFRVSATRIDLPALRQETSPRVLASLGRMSISLHPDTPEGRTLAAAPVAGVAPAAAPSGTKIRSRLFTKYVALFVAVVAV